jgi:hypothetical protein
MWIARAVPIVGVAVILAGSTPAAAAPALDVTPVVTSTPFAAPPGQRVTHVVTLSGTGTGVLPAVRVTFTTTVDLDGVTASASVGSCPIVTALTVVCDLGNVDFSDAGAAAPKVTIAGTLHPSAAAGTLVQNLVNVTAGVPDADPADNVASNAYLVGGANAAPSGSPEPSLTPGRPLSSRVARRGVHIVPILAVLAVATLAAALAAAGLIVRRRRRSS